MGVASFSVEEYYPSISIFSFNYRRTVTPGDQRVKPFIQQLDNNDSQQPPPPTNSREVLATALQCTTATL